jgi:hypothetical protein
MITSHGLTNVPFEALSFQKGEFAVCERIRGWISI